MEIIILIMPKMTSKVVHTAFFGIFSMGRNVKQWHCNSCGSDF